MSKSKNNRRGSGSTRAPVPQRPAVAQSQPERATSSSAAVVRRGASKRDIRAAQRLAARKRRNSIMMGAAAIVVVAVALALVLHGHTPGTTAASKKPASTPNAYANCPTTPAPVAQATAAATPPPVTGKIIDGQQGLKYIDIKVGCGPAVKAGDNVTVDYTGWLASNGKQFDSSLLPGRTPFQVQNVGQASVIQGWNLGLIGMKPGGTRRLIIPPSLGYGAQASGPIPANSTLIFDITLKSIDG